MASFIISQYGGPDGEMGASMRYLAQRFSFANPRIAGVLTDIGTEELAHLEMIGAIVRQLTRGLSAKHRRCLAAGCGWSSIFRYRISVKW